VTKEKKEKNRQIGAYLGISASNVGYRLGKIMKTLRVRSRAGAVRKAEAMGEEGGFSAL
jgi:DNA-binding NarL/FixJ family response regulator